jgi:hypothetical protein
MKNEGMEFGWRRHRSQTNEEIFTMNLIDKIESLAGRADTLSHDLRTIKAEADWSGYFHRLAVHLKDLHSTTKIALVGLSKEARERLQ